MFPQNHATKSPSLLHVLRPDNATAHCRAWRRGRRSAQRPAQGTAKESLLAKYKINKRLSIVFATPGLRFIRTQRLECSPHLLHEKVRLFPTREMSGCRKPNVM